MIKFWPHRGWVSSISFTRTKGEVCGQSASISVKLVVLGFFLGLLFVGCSKEQEPEIVAQVGTSVLTVEDLNSNFPPKFAQFVPKEQYLHYVKRWMDEEVLYQEALKENFQKNAVVQKRIENMTKKILVEAYLDNKMASWTYEPEEHFILEYYESHSQDFVRQEPEIKLAVIRVFDADTAKMIQRNINRDNFQLIQKQHSKGTKVLSEEELRFQSEHQLDSCIREVAFKVPIGGVSNTVSCENSLYIIKVYDKKEAGTIREMEDAEEEIKKILLTRWKEKQLDHLISELRQNLFFTTNLEYIPGVEQKPKSSAKSAHTPDEGNSSNE